MGHNIGPDKASIGVLYCDSSQPLLLIACTAHICHSVENYTQSSVFAVV